MERTFKCSTDSLNGFRTWYRKSDFDYSPPESFYEIRISKERLLNLLNLTPKMGKGMDIDILCEKAEKAGFLWETEDGPIYDKISG